MKTDFLAIHERIKDSIHHAINDEAEDWSIMPSDIADEIDNGFLAYAEGLEEQCAVLQTEQTAFMQTQTEVLNSHVMNEHLHLTSFQTEAIDKVPQKLDRTDFEAHLQDDARHLTFSDKDTLSQVSQKLDREEFEKHAGNYSAHLSHWQSQQIEDAFKFRNMVASVSEATEAGTYLVQSTAEDLPEGLDKIEGYHELRVYSYDSDRKPEKKPFRSEETEITEPEITESETEPKSYHILVQSLDILKNDSYQNYIRLAYLEKTQKPMVEEDLEETETPTYTFSTWKKQVAVGAEGFEDLVESVLGLESKYSTHEKNTQIHTSQAEKDAWNGKAVIKGLESNTGFIEEKPVSWNGFNELADSEYLITYGNPNTPIREWGVLKTRTNGYNVGFQEFRTITGKIYHRQFEVTWQPWKLIAQDQEGVAKIKGLESGAILINADKTQDANNIDYLSVYYVNKTDRINYPNTDIHGFLYTFRLENSSALLQKYITLRTGQEWCRNRENSVWQPWKLIAQDQEGVAKIKGLESADGAELNPVIADDANNVKHTSIYYINVGNKRNYPKINDVGLLKTTQRRGIQTFFQEFQSLWDGKIWYRFFEITTGGWSKWQLIAQPQTALTSRIEELEEKINHLEIALRNTKDTQ